MLSVNTIIDENYLCKNIMKQNTHEIQYYCDAIDLIFNISQY